MPDTLRSAFRFILLVLLSSTGLSLTSRSQVLASNPEREVRDMPAADIDKLTAAGKKYEFTVTAGSVLIDQNGRKITPSDLKKYLKKAKYDKKAFYVLWLGDAQVPIESIEPIVPILESYGVQKIALRRKSSANLAAGENSLAPSAGKKTLVIQGKPNAKSLTASDPFPSMAARPAELRPQKLPPRVRYLFASDDLVIAAARRVTTQLLSPDSSSGSLFTSSVFVNPGAWQYFRNEPMIGHKDAKPLGGRVPAKGKVVQLDGMFLQDADEISVLQRCLRKLIQESGGGTVRALRTDEMDKFWTFISFDITEPVLAIETKDQGYLFILGFVADGVLSLEELNGLPDL